MRRTRCRLKLFSSTSPLVASFCRYAMKKNMLLRFQYTNTPFIYSFSLLSTFMFLSVYMAASAYRAQPLSKKSAVQYQDDYEVADQISRAYDTVYGKGYATDEERYFHDIRHISRVTYYVRILYNLYRTNGLTRDTLSENDLNLLEISAIFHDAGREADGKDYWDGESAILFYRHCVDQLHIDPSRAQTFAEVIMNKDFQPDQSHSKPLNKSYWKMKQSGGEIIWEQHDNYSHKKTLAQMILHDADALDIQRIGSELKFHSAYLDIHHCHFKDTDSLVKEVSILIKEQGCPFDLTTCFNDRTCYTKTVALVNENPHLFPLLYRAYQDSHYNEAKLSASPLSHYTRDCYIKSP